MAITKKPWGSLEKLEGPEAGDRLELLIITLGPKSSTELWRSKMGQVYLTPLEGFSELVELKSDEDFTSDLQFEPTKTLYATDEPRHIGGGRRFRIMNPTSDQLTKILVANYGVTELETVTDHEGNLKTKPSTH
tara:strand:- start:888 stop:1289 length:402 start_codon:yes stop_codon:yes gene_type:complete